MPPAQNSSRIIREHFKLLGNFGKHEAARQASGETRERLWQVVCQTAKIPIVPYEEVVEAWKTFITAQSKRSGIAVNGDVDPQFVSIGITLDRKIFAGHTMRIRPLIGKLVSIYRGSFTDQDAFEKDILSMCRS